MALTATKNLLGKDFQVYAKITGFTTIETGADDIGKHYETTVSVQFFADVEKNYPYDSQNYRIQGLRMVDLNVATFYEKLLQSSEFALFTDI